MQKIRLRNCENKSIQYSHAGAVPPGYMQMKTELIKANHSGHALAESQPHLCMENLKQQFISEGIK